jgi:cytidylate kinase
MHNNVITVDGPSGSGKGTISLRIAKALGWHYLDSGALYRVVALSAQQQAIAVDDVEGLLAMISELSLSFEIDASGMERKVLLAGKNVSQEIRTTQMSHLSSQISSLPEVRTALVARQQSFLQAPGLVTDGRDMGTVIFPNAPLKIYLTASAAVRAQRRFDQLKAKGYSGTLAGLQQELEARDKRDQERATAPLKPAEDACIVDSSVNGIDDVLAEILELAKARQIQVA